VSVRFIKWVKFPEIIELIVEDITSSKSNWDSVKGVTNGILNKIMIAKTNFNFIFFYL
jgi:hypothetical protein